MELGTFGAVIGFATELSGRTCTFCETAIGTAQGEPLKAIFESLLRDAEKDRQLFEQVRREHVTEMILAPIRGLEREDYDIQAKVANIPDGVELVKIAVRLEETQQRFLKDASDKLALPEVARLLRKVSQRKEKNLNQLRSFE